MLKETLLLDSTGPFSDDRNISIGCPERSSVGVLSSWYALRVTYSRELKVQAQLDSMGIRTFVPMVWKRKSVRGKEERCLVPAIGSLCFVYWTREGIEEFIRSYGDASPVHYYWDRIASRPLTVPEKAMEDFMAVASTMDEDLIYITQISEKLREGQLVRVKSGPFMGVEGKIVRIRKSRRLMVELPGMFAVASTYISPENVELI